MRRRVIALLFALPFALLITLGAAKVAEKGPGDETPTTTTAPPPVDPAACTYPVHFFTLPNHYFGPALTQDANPDVTWNETMERAKADPALTVAMQEHVFGPTSVEMRAAKTRDFIANPGNHCLALIQLQGWYNDQKAASQVAFNQRSGPYHTMYMVMQGDIPLIYQGMNDRKEFPVLTVGGKDFSLICGGQPVQMEEFPTVPKAPRGKPGEVPKPPKVKNPPPSPTTQPPVTLPPVITPPSPPTTKCPTCGTPDSGSEYSPPQANNPALVAPTPGYTPGRTEAVILTQPVGTGTNYGSTPSGSAGTGAGGTTNTGQTSGPSGDAVGGTTGGSNGATNNTSNSSGSTEVAPPP